MIHCESLDVVFWNGLELSLLDVSDSDQYYVLFWNDVHPVKSIQLENASNVT